MTIRGPVLICHPKNYSTNAVGLSQKIYNTHVAPDGQKPHIVLGHTHQAQTGFSPDDQKEIIALGCMRDPERTKYQSIDITTYHQWSQGFLAIKSGYFYPVTRNGTDWKMMLGVFCPNSLEFSC